MAKRDIVVIGGSAGSTEGLKTIVRSLPADLPAAVFIIVHLAARSRSYLAEALVKSAAMPLVTAAEGSPLQRATIYVVPPDRHLIVGENHIHLSRGPKEGLQRPSINVAFRSAAAACGSRVIGVLLSGMLDDGAAGMWEIAERGGVTIVQDPAEAPFPSMPLNALNDAVVHHTLRVSEIGPLLSKLTQEQIASPAVRGGAAENAMSHFSGFTCPECRGPLYENGKPAEFRCRVGHSMSLKTLFEEHTSAQERKLYEAMVALEEGADLAERMAHTVSGAGQDALRKEAHQLRQSAGIVRKLIEDREMPSVE